MSKKSAGGFSYLLCSRIKNPEEEEPAPKLIIFGGVSSGGVLFLWVLDLETTQQRNPPGGGFHSIKSPANVCPLCSFKVLPEFEHSRTNCRPENRLKPFLLSKMKRPSENSEELRMSGSVWLKPRPGTAILLLRRGVRGWLGNKHSVGQKKLRHHLKQT